MQRRRVFSLTAAVSLLGMAACTAIAGLDGEFIQDTDAGNSPNGNGTDSGLDASRTDGGPQTDGQTPLGDGSKPDAKDEDVIVIPPFDAAVPSSLSVGAGTPFFCGTFSKPPFCFDFENVEDAQKTALGWSEVNPTDAKGLTTVDAGGWNGLAALRAQTGTVPASSAVINFISAQPNTATNYNAEGTTKRGLDLKFKFRVVSATKRTTIAAFDFWGQRLGIEVFPGGCGTGVNCLRENEAPGRSTATSTPTAFAFDTWYQAEIVLYRVPGGWFSQTMVGMTTLAKHAVDAMPNARPLSGGGPDGGPEDLIRLYAGSFDSSGLGMAEIFIDEVVVLTINQTP